MTSHTEELLNLYVDGELPLDRQGELFAHLAESREARLLFNALMDFRLATRMDAISVAPAVDEALFRRIDGLRANVQRNAQHAEDERAAVLASEEVVIERGPQSADVEHSGRAGSETNADVVGDGVGHEEQS